MKKKIFIIVTAIIALIIIKLSFGAVMSFFGGKNKGPAPANVVVAPVKEESVIQTFESPARVVSKYQVSILARISGYLQKSYFKEGDFVRAGETLFLIEPAEYQYASGIASANIQNIKAQLDYANKQLSRAEELVKQDYIAKSRYDEILSNRNALQAQLKAAQSSYKDTNRNLSYTKVKAPVDGRIGIIDITVGNYVSPSSGSLTTINSTNPIYVTFSLASDDFSSLVSHSDKADEKRRVELYFQNGVKYDYDGIQDFLDNKVDETTGTITMRATFQNPDNKLLHGEFVNIKIFANKPIMLPIVPVVAVQENQEGKFLYVLGENNMPELRYIKTQGQSGDNWIIKEGVKKGEKIIVDGILKVIPGMPVNVVSKEEMEKINQPVEDNKGKK